MKRLIIGMIVAFVIAVSCSGCSSIDDIFEAKEIENEYVEIPGVSVVVPTTKKNEIRRSVGAVSNGFTIAELGKIDMYDAELIKFVHDKTGAVVYFVLNDDKERGFNLTFLGDPSSNNGAMHVMEHSCCAASEKYPGQDVFFDLFDRGYITDTNAFTQTRSTSFSAAALDEEQLLNAADFYLDCAFHSAILTEPKYVYREGMRYELNSPEDEIRAEGIVYNEMLGIYSDIDYFGWREVAKRLFPEVAVRFDSGGEPDDILKLTYDDVIKEYKRMYHPSNSTVLIYGDADMAQYLALLDGYYSQFEKQDFFNKRSKYDRFEEIIVDDVDFPANVDADENSGIIYYTFKATDKIPYLDDMCMGLGAKFLSDETVSPLMQKLNDSGIGSSYSVDAYSVGDQFVVIFEAYDADTSRKQEFELIVDTTLREMVNEGFNREALRALVESEELALSLSRNNSGIGFDYVYVLDALVESADEDRLYPDKMTAQAKKLISDSYIEKLYSKYVLENKTGVLVGIRPKPGLFEEKEEALREELANRKAAMSEQEINEMIRETQEFHKWNDETGTIESTISKLVTADAGSLENFLAGYEYTRHDEYDIPIYTAEVDKAVTFYEFRFDLSKYDKDEIHVLLDYIDIVGQSTSTRSAEKVSADCNRYMSNFDVNVEFLIGNNGSAPYLRISYYTYPSKAGVAAEAAFDEVFNVDLIANKEYLRQIMTNFLFNANSDDSLMYGAYGEGASYAYPSFAWAREYGSKPQFDHVRDVLSSDEKFDQFIEDIARIRREVIREDSCRLICIGNSRTEARSCELMYNQVHEFSSDEEPREGLGSVMDLERGERTTAIRANVQNASAYSRLDVTGYNEKDLANLMLAAKIFTGEYLTPYFRFQRSAYTCTLSINAEGTGALMLNNSPTYKEFLEIRDTVGDIYSEILKDMTEQSLNNYKLAVLSSVLRRSGEWADSYRAYSYFLKSFSNEHGKELVTAIQSITVDDLKAGAAEFEKVISGCGICVIASDSMIKSNEDMFDVILDY